MLANVGFGTAENEPSKICPLPLAAPAQMGFGRRFRVTTLPVADGSPAPAAPAAGLSPSEADFLSFF